MRAIANKFKFWAKGYNDDFTEEIYSHLKEQKPFSDNEFKILNDCFVEYAVIGGMPAVVKQFLNYGTW